MFPICQRRVCGLRDLLSTPNSSGLYPRHSHLVIPPRPMIDTRLKVLARRIDALVRSSPYSPAEISRLLNVDRSAVSRWMNGDRTPTMKNLLELSELLNVEMGSLWTGPEAMPATPEQKAVMERMASMTAEQQQAFLALVAATMGMVKP